MMLNWHVSKSDQRLIQKIAYRAVDMFHAVDLQVTPAQMMMDVTAVHANGNRLKLEDLLESDQANFAHDIGGIYRNLDRETGKLQNCFVPRFSV